GRGGRAAPAVPSARFFFLFPPPEASAPSFRTSWEAILETERLAREMGARYVLFVLPRYQQYDPRESPRDPERRVFPPDAEGRLVPFEYFPGQARTGGFPLPSPRGDFPAAPALPKGRGGDPPRNAESHPGAAAPARPH